jgi:hypothetical protein
VGELVTTEEQAVAGARGYLGDGRINVLRWPKKKNKNPLEKKEEPIY